MYTIQANPSGTRNLEISEENLATIEKYGQVVFNPMYKFIRMYIIRLGFLDGIEGFLLASTSSMYSMVKYFKLREIYKNGSYRSKKN